MLPDAPIAEHGFFVTHFLTVKDQAKSAEFYLGILGGKVVRQEDPTYIKLANSWLILNSGGGPTPDKPEVGIHLGVRNRAHKFAEVAVGEPGAGRIVPKIESIRLANIARAVDAHFLTEPLDNHGHEMRCDMRDPDGYLIEVGQYSPKAVEGFSRSRA